MTMQRWPSAWLMTAERMGDALPGAIARAAAAGAGIIVRHHHSLEAERREIAERVLAEGAMLGIAGDLDLARMLGASLVHNPPLRDVPDLPFSLSVHDEAEARTAHASAAALVFVSPLYPTRTHPGTASLGEAKARALALITAKPAIALGGISQNEGRRLVRSGWAGWAGIDAWL